MCRIRNKCLGVPITCRPSFSLFLSSGHIQNCAGAVCSHSLEPIVEFSAVVRVRWPHLGSLISTHPEGRVFTMLYTMKSMLRSQLSRICQHIMDYINCWIYNWMKYALHHFRTFTLWILNNMSCGILFALWLTSNILWPAHLCNKKLQVQVSIIWRACLWTFTCLLSIYMP